MAHCQVCLANFPAMRVGTHCEMEVYVMECSPANHTWRLYPKKGDEDGISFSDPCPICDSGVITVSKELCGGLILIGDSPRYRFVQDDNHQVQMYHQGDRVVCIIHHRIKGDPDRLISFSSHGIPESWNKADRESLHLWLTAGRALPLFEPVMKELAIFRS